MKKHVVVQGEDMISIALQNGVADYRDIFNHEANQRLQKLRPNPMCLAEGDIVYIPELENISFTVSTNQKHVVNVTIQKVKFQVLLTDEFDIALANKDYILKFSEEIIKGQTNKDGLVECELPANITTVYLDVIYDKELDIVWDYEFNLGCLDPEDEVSGIQGRLNNMGLPVGNIDNDFGKNTSRALNQYNTENNLTSQAVIVQNYEE